MSSFKNLIEKIAARYAEPASSPSSEEPKGEHPMVTYFEQRGQAAGIIGDIIGLALAHVADVAVHTGVKPEEDLKSFIAEVECCAEGTARNFTEAGGGGTWEEMADWWFDLLTPLRVLRDGFSSAITRSDADLDEWPDVVDEILARLKARMAKAGEDRPRTLGGSPDSGPVLF